MSTIVVGVDGSSGSQAAPQWAATTARETLAAFQVDPKLIVDELQGLLDGPWTRGVRKAVLRSRRGSRAAMSRWNCSAPRRG
jgi:hypothetical protein